MYLLRLLFAIIARSVISFLKMSITVKWRFLQWQRKNCLFSIYISRQFSGCFEFLIYFGCSESETDNRSTVRHMFAHSVCSQQTRASAWNGVAEWKSLAGNAVCYFDISLNTCNWKMIIMSRQKKRKKKHTLTRTRTNRSTVCYKFRIWNNKIVWQNKQILAFYFRY